MNINGICYIANKYQSKEKDFERSTPNAYGKLRATGRVCWSDQSKDKGGVVNKTYTYKRFVCFDVNVIDIIDACKDNLLVIEGYLKGESYVDKEGNKKNSEKIFINKVKRYEKQENAINNNDDIDYKSMSIDDIPF